MKKIFTTLLLLIGINSISQTTISVDTTEYSDISIIDTVKKDTTQYFQYRISIDEITTVTVSKTVESQMFDIFRSQILFNENLKQFIFVSSEDVDRYSLNKTFYNYQIIYFKKLLIKNQ